MRRTRNIHGLLNLYSAYMIILSVKGNFQLTCGIPSSRLCMIYSMAFMSFSYTFCNFIGRSAKIYFVFHNYFVIIFSQYTFYNSFGIAT